jgi:preprotein translocase subunit SecA
MDLPVLVGTTNVDVSETLSRMLKRRGIRHNVLNAKQHHREAEIVAEAGQPGALTIATNMAGRGTDIKLGPGVTDDRSVRWARERDLALDEIQPVDPTMYDEKIESRAPDHLVEDGGLHILGSERHESRRIDRQLRGRAGRQGDPGATQFFLSLEDDLMRLFGSERIASAMERMGAEEGEVITHGLVTKSIERAQKRVEGNNFEARKRLLDYDDVMNQQREVIYDLRLFALEGGEDLKGEIWEMIEHSVDDLLEEYAPEHKSPDHWDLAGLRRRLLLDLFVVPEALPEENDPEHELEQDEIREAVLSPVREGFRRKIDGFGEAGEKVMSFILLTTIDDKWKDHLYDLDHLKASIGFRGWGQKDPLVEYKKEAFEMFVDLVSDLRSTVAQNFFRAQITIPRRVVRQQPLIFSGPTDTPETGVSGPGGRAVARSAASLRQTPPADDMGIAARARSDPEPQDGASDPAAGVGVPGVIAPRGPDPRKLVTNRGEDGPKHQPAVAKDEPGRNDPCWCGSGKKFKKCHGRGAA